MVGSLILHQKGMRFLIFITVFFSCGCETIGNGTVVDKTTKTQDGFCIVTLGYLCYNYKSIQGVFVCHKGGEIRESNSF